MANKTILSLKKIITSLPSPCNCYVLADHIFHNLRIFFNKEIGDHKQMSGSEGFISVVMQIT